MPDATIGVEGRSSWTPSYSVTHLSGASPEAETKEELQTSQDIPTVDELITKEIESVPSHTTYTQGPTTSGITAEMTKDNGTHYFPRVPESLDEAPER